MAAEPSAMGMAADQRMASDTIMAPDQRMAANPIMAAKLSAMGMAADLCNYGGSMAIPSSKSQG